MIAIKWYALKITIGEEEAVEKQLKNAGFEVLNPKYQLRERKNGQWREKEKYLLSGYVLVKTELTAEIYYQLKNMWYISYLLKGEIKETGFYTMERPKDQTADTALSIPIRTARKRVFTVGG